MAVFLTDRPNVFYWEAENAYDGEPGEIYGLGGGDYIHGDSGNDTIDGGDGRDTVHGLGGSDTLVGGAGYDELYGHEGADELRSGTGSDLLNGGGGDDTLYIEASAADGSDRAFGGAGDDLYIFINGLNVALARGASGDEGYDTVTTSSDFGFDITIGYWLGIEAIVLNGSAHTSAFGNSRDNDIFGNVGNNHLDGAGGNDFLAGGDGADTLQGGSGADTMAGEFGDDTYLVDQANDQTNEGANRGIDTILSPINIDLQFHAHVENLTLTGDRPVIGYGNDLSNLLAGNGADNLFYGRLGTDTMAGGLGNDVYVLEDLHVIRINGQIAGETYDIVQEQPGQGIDAVFVGYQPSNIFPEGHDFHTLNDNVENGVVTGTEDFDLWGNELDNRLTGNEARNALEGLAGNDTLDGGLSHDTLTGGTGNDAYILSSIGLRRTADGFLFPAYDRVIEETGSGVDTVWVRRAESPLGGEFTSYVLGAGIEAGIVDGTGAFDLTGNDLANSLVGNNFANALGGGAAGNDTIDGQGGNDTMDGGTGADSMQGGRGNDTMVCSQPGDVALDEENGGFDTVHSDVSHALSAHVEDLTLFGAANLTGTGNALHNRIVGQAGRNQLLGLDGRDDLHGMDGDDLLRGGFGNDTLTGGAGADRFRFETPPNASINRDLVVDFAVGLDEIEIENAIYAGLSEGGLPSGAFRIGAARDANDRILYNSQNGNLSYDPDGDGAQAAVAFAKLDPDLALTADDIRVI